MRFWVPARLIFILLVSACQAEPPNTTANAARLLSMPEQVALVVSSGSGGGGAAGALIYGAIDGASKARAETEVAPLLAALQNFDYRTEFLTAATSKLSTLPDLRIVIRPMVNVVAGSETSRKLYEQSPDPSVLFIGSGYSFSSGTLVVSVTAAIFPKSPELKKFRPRPNDSNPVDPGNAIYFNRLHALRHSPTPSDVRANLTDAINEVTAALAADLQRTR
jgi:hypothetical protein